MKKLTRTTMQQKAVHTTAHAIGVKVAAGALAAVIAGGGAIAASRQQSAGQASASNVREAASVSDAVDTGETAGDSVQAVTNAAKPVANSAKPSGNRAKSAANSAKSAQPGTNKPVTNAAQQIYDVTVSVSNATESVTRTSETNLTQSDSNTNHSHTNANQSGTNSAEANGAQQVTDSGESTTERSYTVHYDHSIYEDIINDVTEDYASSTGPVDGLGNAYGFYDINADGMDELIVSDVYTDEDGSLSLSTVCGIYTVIGDSPVVIAEGWSRNRYYIYEDALILNEGSSGADSSSSEVLRMRKDGSLQLTDLSSEDLGEQIEVEYILLEREEQSAGYSAPVDEEADPAYSGADVEEETDDSWTGEDADIPYAGFDPDNLSFEEILSELDRVSQMSAEAYEATPDYYDERYTYLGEGILPYLIYRDVDIYTLEFFHREYDIDGDGEDELLFGRGISPFHVELIAVYNQGEKPITGEDLAQFSLPNDADADVPAWE